MTSLGAFFVVVGDVYFVAQAEIGAKTNFTFKVVGIFSISISNTDILPKRRRIYGLFVPFYT